MDGTQVIREGHMYRRYGNKDRSWSSWKKQWIVLRASQFSVAKSAKDKEKDWTHHPLKGCIIRRSGPFQGFPDSFSDWPAPPLDHCFVICDSTSHEHTFWVDKSADGVLWVSRFKDAIAAANPGSNAVQLTGTVRPPKVAVDATYVAPTAEWAGGDDDSSSKSSQSRTSSSVTGVPSKSSSSLSSVNKGSSSSLSTSDRQATWSNIKLLTEQDQIAKALLKYVDQTGCDISVPDSSGWTLLLDAAASQNLTLCIELLKLKANPAVRSDSGNTILHSLVRSELCGASLTVPQVKVNSSASPERLEKEASKLLDMILKTRGETFLEFVNNAGETALFRAVQFGSQIWTRLLLQREANPFLAFVPHTRIPTHTERYRKVYTKSPHIKRKSSKGSLLVSHNSWATRGLQTEQLCAAIRKNPASEPRSFIVLDPLSQTSLETLWTQFQQSSKPTESWAAMQQVGLDLDRLTLLKEQEGRYYRAFDSTNEVLSSAVETVSLINTHHAPISWEIAKYHPALESWDSSSLRFELQGPRKGVLQPLDTVSFKVTVLAMKPTKFFQLMAISYSELSSGSAIGWSTVGATYLLFDADIQPPAELRDFEIPAKELPPLTTVLGSGASSSVYKVTNFLGAAKCQDEFLAVKQFSLSLDNGLEEHAEDFRKFKLELFISSRLQHPNIVRTYGFVGSPPAMVMEFVRYSLRGIIDATDITLTPANKMKLTVGLCRGMAYLHQQGYVHRDMKPGNVLVTEQLDAKIADFGIAMSGGQGRKNAVEFEGTIFYMAPEVFRDKVFSKEADVYAGGITIYELIKGVDAMTEQGCTEEKSRLGFAEERIKATYPVKVADLASLDQGIRNFLERTWAPSPRRITFEAAVELLGVIRKEFLKYDVDQQVVDVAAGEVSLGDVLRDWSTRLAADINVKKFRREIAASTAFPYLVEQLLEADLDQSTVGAIETFLCDFFGPSFKVLPINLRAMYHIVNQMGGGAKAREVRDMVMKHVTRALSPADSQAPQQLTQDQLQTWLEFVATVNKEPALKAEASSKRFESDKRQIQEKIRKLQRSLKELNKRVAAIDAQPVMTEYFSTFMSSDEQSIEALEKIITKAEEDADKLDGHLEYKHYSVVFENPSTAEAERVRVMFGHFAEELNILKGKLVVIRSLVAKNLTTVSRVEAVRARILSVEARFPPGAFGDGEKEKDREKDKEAKEKTNKLGGKSVL